MQFSENSLYNDPSKARCVFGFLVMSILKVNTIEVLLRSVTFFFLICYSLVPKMDICLKSQKAAIARGAQTYTPKEDFFFAELAKL